MRFLVLLVYFLGVAAEDYYGVFVGKLRNASYALQGDVYLVNSTHIQIIDITIKRLIDRTKLNFVFQNSKHQKRATAIFEYRTTNDGDWLRLYEKELRDGITNNKRLIVEIPGTASDWEIFGVWSDSERYISSVELKKEAPHPTCCIRDPNREVIQGHYGTRLNPIVIIDAQTLLLRRFTIEGSKPPDAWIYAGRGEINQENGRKAFIVGRDTPAQVDELMRCFVDSTVELGQVKLTYVNVTHSRRSSANFCLIPGREFAGMTIQTNSLATDCGFEEKICTLAVMMQIKIHCSIREDWTNEDITVRLADEQTVYDIKWISVFCYNYSVDFAHLPVNLNRNVDFVPAYLPEFRKTAPFRETRRKCQ